MKYLALFCLLSVSSGCDDAEPAETLNCDTSELSYDNFGSSFMASYCTTCHSASLMGSAERQLAPTGIDFDTYEDVLAQLSRIQIRAVDLETMPPLRSTDRPSAQEVVSLDNWIECGAP